MAQMLEGDVSDMEGAELLAFLDNPLCADGWLHSEFYLHFRRGATYRVHEAMMRTLKGGCLPVALSCSPLPRQQHAMVVIALDMSVVRNLHAQLESQAVTDALTGLLNRRGFHRALESSLVYLRHFELDTLKIDRLFIANMLDSPRDAPSLQHHAGLSGSARGARQHGHADAGATGLEYVAPAAQPLKRRRRFRLADAKP